MVWIITFSYKLKKIKSSSIDVRGKQGCLPITDNAPSSSSLRLNEGSKFRQGW